MAFRSLYNSYKQKHPGPQVDESVEKRGLEHDPEFCATLTRDKIRVRSEWRSVKADALEDAYHKLVIELGLVPLVAPLPPLPVSRPMIVPALAPRLIVISDRILDSLPLRTPQIIFTRGASTPTMPWNCFTGAVFDDLMTRWPPLHIDECNALEFGRFLAWLYGFIEGANAIQKKYVIRVSLGPEFESGPVLLESFRALGVLDALGAK